MPVLKHGCVKQGTMGKVGFKNYTMNKELILEKLNRFRQHLEEEKEFAKKMKLKSDNDLARVGINKTDLDNKIQSQTIEIKELEELILSIELL